MIRADFARYGWSVTADLGTRLRYGDAIALYEQLAEDPSTWTGAESLGLDYPAAWAEIPVIYAIAGKDYPKPFDNLEREMAEREQMKEREETMEASRHMSAAFRSLYEQ